VFKTNRLNEVPTAKCIKNTNAISTASVSTKHAIAVDSYVNLNIFIVATIIHTQTMSLTIQFLPENTHPIMMPNEISTLIKSSILIYNKFPNLKTGF
jgi:hypothetical protein